MGGPGDRAVAGLLSALAEAPDFAAAASFFLTHVVEITKASKACILRLDAAHEHIELVSTLGFDADPPRVAIPISDLSSPLVICALTLAPVQGDTPSPLRSLGLSESWVALPLSQPRFRGAPEILGFQRGAELVGSPSIKLLETPERRLGSAPAGGHCSAVCHLLLPIVK